MAAVLTAVIAFSQLVLGFMGVYVSLRTPQPKHHWYWMVAFSIIGLVGIGLTFSLADQAARDQDNAAKQLGQATMAATQAAIAATHANTEATNANAAATAALASSQKTNTAINALSTETERYRVLLAGAPDSFLIETTRAFASRIYELQHNWWDIDGRLVDQEGMQIRMPKEQRPLDADEIANIRQSIALQRSKNSDTYESQIRPVISCANLLREAILQRTALSYETDQDKAEDKEEGDIFLKALASNDVNVLSAFTASAYKYLFKLTARLTP